MKKVLLSLMAILALGVPLTANAAFTDVDKYDQASSAIDWLERNGVVEGYADGSFGVDNYVNRAEFLKMLYEAMGVDEYTNYPLVDKGTFSDLPTGKVWYSNYISKAYADGVVDGYGDGTFGPDRYINFAEASKIIGNAFLRADEVLDAGYEIKSSVCIFDESYYVGEWFTKYIGLLDQSCIYPDSLLKRDGYHPGHEVTRAQMALMIFRAKAVHDLTGGAEKYKIFGGGDAPDDVLEEGRFVNRVTFKGDVIGDWKVNDKDETNGLAMSFTGETTVSGSYFWNGFHVGMNLDEESLKKIPIEAKDDSVKGITFTYEEFDLPKEELGPKGSEGQATVVIDFVDYKLTSQNYVSVRLKEVVNRKEIIVDRSEELCGAEPEIAPIGSAIYPIHPKYEPLFYLGQLFTADDCGGDRIEGVFGVEGESYVTGLDLGLDGVAGTELGELLDDVGFECSFVNTEAAECSSWELNKTVSLSEILRLKEYYAQLRGDDCTICG